MIQIGYVIALILFFSIAFMYAVREKDYQKAQAEYWRKKYYAEIERNSRH